MKGVSVGLVTAVAFSGCAASGGWENVVAESPQAQFTEQAAALAESAPEVELNGVGGGEEVCRMELVLGTRIPRRRCELVSPAEAALIEMQTEDEIEYARELLLAGDV